MPGAALRTALLALAAPLALAGVAIHALPLFATRVALRAIAYGPSQIAFARITSGFFFITLSYAALATAMATLLAAPALAVIASLALCASLGAIALAYWDWIRPILERRRLASCARRHPRLVALAKRNQARLGEWVDALGGGSGPAP
jgi:hypothetical protein